MVDIADSEQWNAWNPGVRPGIPAEFRTLESIVRTESIFGDADDIIEVSRLTGLPLAEVTPFRPRRLALHELIIRVTADLAVAEGNDQETLGLNFRRMVKTIWDNHVESRMEVIEQIYTDLRSQVEGAVRKILADTLFQAEPESPPRRFPFSLYEWRSRKKSTPHKLTAEDAEQHCVAGYKAAGLSGSDPLQQAIYQSLYRVLGALLATRGYIGSDSGFLEKTVADHVCNRYGSQLIGAEIARLMATAIDQEQYIRVRAQPAPVMFSLKGTSAAGKSSLRSMLKQFIGDQKIAAEGYATISPDIWRKFLLDYDALGAATKYAGYLTSREVAMIDGKLDRYIQEQAERNRAIPHLVIDRFRFDSFSSKHVPRILDATYAKYVETVYMYFVVTPPEETVERGWRRALDCGRYKAVEDFLGHCVEAYTGMPLILFRWLAHPRPDYRYVFLDNRVPKGTFPEVCAHGNRDAMIIHDPRIFINVERYKKINVFATSPDEVYHRPAEMTVANNMGFLKECIRKIPDVRFIGRTDEAPCLHTIRGKLERVDAASLATFAAHEEVAEIMALVLQELGHSPMPNLPSV